MTTRAKTPPPDTRSIYERITIAEARERLRSTKFEPPWGNLDPLISPIVRVFYEEGAETYESCQGGPGHPFPCPTIRFFGGVSEGLRLVSIALAYDLNPTGLSRIYDIVDKELVGPRWEMTFHIPGHEDWFDIRNRVQPEG